MYKTYLTLTALLGALASPAVAAEDRAVVPVHYKEYQHTHGEGYGGYVGNCEPTGYVCPRSYYYNGRWYDQPPYSPPEPLPDPDPIPDTGTQTNDVVTDPAEEKKRGLGGAIGDFVDVLIE